MQTNPNEMVWCERYRPLKIDDVILPESIKKQFRDIVTSGHIGNLLLSGKHGTGKTTVAKAMCRELGVDYEVINASDKRGLEVIRDDIKAFASRASLTGKGKCVILDEADYLVNTTQAALRNAMEGYSKSCSFILTCNYPNKIMPALHSRCHHIKFEIDNKERNKLMKEMLERTQRILESEGIEYDYKSVAYLINHHFPDNRKILNQLDAYAKSGKIDEGILNELGSVSIKEVVKFMKDKDFKKIRQWCAENAYNDIESMYSNLYQNMTTFLDKSSIPEAILIFEDYQRHDANVPDREIHIAAMCTEMMMRLTFR